MKPKFCVNCSFYHHTVLAPMCLHQKSLRGEETLNVVTGKWEDLRVAFFCCEARADDKLCGPSGEWFIQYPTLWGGLKGLFTNVYAFHDCARPLHGFRAVAREFLKIKARKKCQ
jgi:hypothetical protein